MGNLCENKSDCWWGWKMTPGICGGNSPFGMLEMKREGNMSHGDIS